MRLKELSRPAVQPLPQPVLEGARVEAAVLRLDLVHPEVSGNKWYKLKEYLEEARAQNCSTVITFGGAYSNHIAATAAAGQLAGFRCAGIIRGERARQLSPTLLQAEASGMDLHFVSREAYREGVLPPAVAQQYPGAYIIREGGYGLPGMRGAKAILEETGINNYTHVLAAVGTGTTLAGLAAASGGRLQVTGLSVLKNNLGVQDAINSLLPADHKNGFTLLHDFHFGGYAKCTPALIRFMNDWYRQTGIPSDFVYTGKLFYGFSQLCAAGWFPEGSNILVVHSGGLQGNASLTEGTLIF